VGRWPGEVCVWPSAKAGQQRAYLTRRGELRRTAFAIMGGAGEEGDTGEGLDSIIPPHSCPQGSSLADFQVSSARIANAGVRKRHFLG